MQVIGIFLQGNIKMALYNRILRASFCERVLLSGTKTSNRYFSDQNQDAEEKTENEIDPAIDRTKIIPVEISMKYLQSKAYQQTYGEKPVWVLYRRNHKGVFAPRKTRKSCVRNGVISTGNPCPICRDEYLTLDPKNTKLLEQFISQYTGHILDAFHTGLCQKKQKELLVAIERAWDQGNITYDVPFREYDYSLYYKNTTTQ